MPEVTPGGGMPEVETRLVLDAANPPMKLTARKECDVRTALTRGLAEYVSQLRATAAGGRRVLFKRSSEQYEEPETRAAYPSAVVTTVGEGKYDSSNLTPSVGGEQIKAPDGRFVVRVCEYTQVLNLDAWANDIEERAALADALEDALTPTENRFGLILELPFYFNQRATYTLLGLSFSDTEDTAKKRYRIATFSLEGRIVFTKLKALPLARPRFDLAAIDTDVIVEISVP